MLTGLRLKRGLWSAVTILMALALLLTSCSIGSVSPAPHMGATAPDFTLPTLDGGTVTLSQFRGKPVFINFWATWCPACQGEMPFIQKLLADQEAQGFVVLTVDLREASSTVKTFMDKNGYNFPVALDAGGSVGGAYSVEYLPTTYIVDSKGVVRQVRTGAYPNEEAMLAQIKAVR